MNSKSNILPTSLIILLLLQGLMASVCDAMPCHWSLDERVLRLEDGINRHSTNLPYVDFELRLTSKESESNVRPLESLAEVEMQGLSFQLETRVLKQRTFSEGIIRLNETFQDGVWLFQGRAISRQQLESIVADHMDVQIIGSGTLEVASPIQLKFERFVQEGKISRQAVEALIKLDRGDVTAIKVQFEDFEQLLTAPEDIDWVYNRIAHRRGVLTSFSSIGEVVNFPSER